ncbi:hypothetical protein ACFORG_05915 [Lutimaribacter marinistellae]|uniref:Uncharacterized protein n=1 Tax=Lutimaribacter marinistellae TaxID=1820329 RepID=A0ABV7TCJ1_9RHOB
MSDLTLTKIRLRHGVWEGRITGSPAGKKPEIKVLWLDQPVDQVEVTEGSDPSYWDLKITIPTDAVADGVQSFIIIDTETNTKLGNFTLIAGEPVSDDLRAEVDLLRAELDMLKRAFRRHCLETM